ncbi:MAG: insulinase family protein [Bacteroidota bacterium]|nr:insulinase family protein [Bacteroidota bacterium]MDP4229998.1 insulinase family protein [Bacteroidota bacterium]MDP4235225.1 insulinase family protein [Bacteroidota bacterium]
MKIFYLLFASLLLLTSAEAERSMAHSFTDDASITDVQEFSVDGIDVLLRDSKEAPVVTAVLFIKGGSSAIPQTELPSSEYFALSVIPASGSEFTTKQRFRRVMMRMGSGLGGSDARDYAVLSLRATRENFDTTWKFFSEVIVHPTVDPVEFQNLKRNALVSFQSGRNNPDVLSRTILDSIYFLDHPYGRRLTKENIEMQTPENVLAYYKSIMIKSRMLLVVVGNISRSELEKKMRKGGLTSLPQGSYMPPEIPIPEKSKTPGAYFPPIDRKLPTKYVVGYHRIPNRGDSDYYPYIRLRNFFGGFLFQHLRVQTNLAYAPNNEDIDGRASVEMISFQTPYVDSAIRLVFKDVDFFQQNTLLESAIKGNVAKWATSNYLKQETTAEQAVALGQAQLLTGSWRNAFISFDKLSNIKGEDIVRVAKTYFKNFNWVVVGDTRDVDKKLLESR